MAKSKGYMEGMREMRSGKSGSKRHEAMESRMFKRQEQKGSKAKKKGCK